MLSRAFTERAAARVNTENKYFDCNKLLKDQNRKFDGLILFYYIFALFSDAYMNPNVSTAFSDLNTIKIPPRQEQTNMFFIKLMKASHRCHM